MLKIDFEINDLFLTIDSFVYWKNNFSKILDFFFGIVFYQIKLSTIVVGDPGTSNDPYMTRVFFFKKFLELTLSCTLSIVEI